MTGINSAMMHISKPISEDSGSKLRNPFAIKRDEKYKTIGWRKKGFPLGTVREGDWDIFTYVPWEHKLPFFTLIPREAKYLL